ncbi:MAG: AAA family ATPase [Phycisphaerales bacterium]|nr:AAA family ATPase [Phycisphaerales bacterium]
MARTSGHPDLLLPEMPSTASLHVVILAGPNGAGKTTAAPKLLRGRLHVPQFVNADVIARGLAGFDPESVAYEASRIMLSRINALADSGVSFALETTLAARTLAPWLQARMTQGYETSLMYLWLPSADLAVARVRDRASRGGHSIDETTVRRRYDRSLQNLFTLYIPIVSAFRVYDSAGAIPLLIARGGVGRATLVREKSLWERIQEQSRDSTD